MNESRPTHPRIAEATRSRRAERDPARASASLRPEGTLLQRWNRKAHYYLGLYLLFFIWLFSFSGLVLNHSQWTFAKFWESRQETSSQRDIQAPPPGGDLDQARDLMRQLGIRGEIEWTATRDQRDLFEFRISRPGHIVDIHADFTQSKATLKRIDLNAWGILRLLHSFTGVRPNDARNERDWFLTSLWAWAMDAVAAGLICMVISGFCLWWIRPRKRRLGLIALMLGFLSCGLFCFGLRCLY